MSRDEMLREVCDKVTQSCSWWIDELEVVVIAELHVHLGLIQVIGFLSQMESQIS